MQNLGDSEVSEVILATKNQLGYRCRFLEVKRVKLLMTYDLVHSN